MEIKTGSESSNRLDSSAALAPKQFARSEARDTSGAPIEVMVLGTFHFHKVPDSTAILAPERQAQIRAVVRALADFRPTKVALEEVPEDAARLDSLYQAYREGRHELSSNERQQLQEVQMRRLELGAGSTYVGLKPITTSYEWNLRIFATWHVSLSPATGF